MAWNHLPSEIFDMILQGADLETIKNVRLVNKVTAQRCLSPRFLSCASHIKTDLTEQSLWKVIERTAHPIFSRAVRYLTVLAVCYDHRGKHVLFEKHLTTRGYWNPLNWRRRYGLFYQTPRATYNLEWLQQQQASRDAVSDQFIIQVLTSALDSFIELKQINLQAQVMTSPNERWSPYTVLAPVILPWASHVCYLVLAAVAKGESTVPEINIYTAYERDSKPARFPSPNEVYCGVSIEKLSHYLDKINDGVEVRLPFGSMNVCLATERQAQFKQEPGWLQTGYASFLSVFSGSVAGESPRDDLSGLMRLLKATPHLQGLKIEFDHEDLATRNEFRGIFTSVANQASFRQLKECTLIRLPITPAALLRFLEAHRDLINLTLKYLSVSSDSLWDPIFRFVGAEMTDLRWCTIDHLYHGDARIPLDRENFSKNYCPRRAYLPVEFANNGGPDVYFIFLPNDHNVPMPPS
ncbi:hypothetical protein N7478_000817 [Penicillium angulare]|uniref:uncharacterized protein n=1 Tax=Penicillium angulare TaxID=116970 RepID=UPI002540CC28|nr:uncharacterized protein N7478_000817 [Penicillium angulare]KAJ5291566.1 hypothetical protein N7478_000817 [Penicillium angulare]